MKAADYVALYSGYEGLSHTLLESLRAGTPVIASDKGGNPEVVQHGINGLLVAYANAAISAEALADAIREALRPGVRASAGGELRGGHGSLRLRADGRADGGSAGTLRTPHPCSASLSFPLYSNYLQAERVGLCRLIQTVVRCNSCGFSAYRNKSTYCQIAGA